MFLFSHVTFSAFSYCYRRRIQNHVFHVVRGQIVNVLVRDE